MNSTTTPFVISPDDNLLQDHPHLKRLSSELALKYAHNELVTEDHLKAVGSALWNALEINDEYQEACDNLGRRVCPIIISSQNAAIQKLPWETLYHPESGFLGKHIQFALSRQLPDVALDNIPLETGPLRVLLFTTITEDQARLDVEKEQAQVQEALLPWISEGKVHLDMPDDGRFSTFKNKLDTFKPHLVFLSGHGKFYDQRFSGKDKDYSVFTFEAETGTSSQEVDEKALAQSFTGSEVQCVVLSACQSGQNASDSLSTGLMQQLALSGIPHVIGMRESVLDHAGIQFARTFCDKIAQENRIDIALQHGRAAITKPLQGVFKDLSTEQSQLAELSLGQWCLPLLISQNPETPLIDWQFALRTIQTSTQNQTLNHIPLASQFIGRRKEIRELEAAFAQKQQRQLLITGAGGQGKTTLAGRLVQKLQQQGWTAIDWSMREDIRWSNFQNHLMLLPITLGFDELKQQQYDKVFSLQLDEIQKAKVLLQLLAQHCNNQLLIIFDNLESIQNPSTLALDEEKTQSHYTSWIQAAQQQAELGISLILTSRWKLPEWETLPHLALEQSSYNDYLALTRQQENLDYFVKNRNKLREIHQALHGNARALEFFSAAIKGIDPTNEEKLLVKLKQTQAESQVDMALEFIIQHRSKNEQDLLQRTLTYQNAVPIEGLIKLALFNQEPYQKLNNARDLIKGLQDASLLEINESEHLHCSLYQCSTQVRQWLEENTHCPPSRPLLAHAAEYQLYLFSNQSQTLAQAIQAHQALEQAEQQNTADRFALDTFIDQLSLNGFFLSVLQHWLPKICKSKDDQVRGDALNQMGKQLIHIGEFDTAMDYLKQSLAITQEIGNKSGERTTLNNISQIYSTRGDYETALDYLKQSLAITQEISNKSAEDITLTQEIGNKWAESRTLNNISGIYNARGDYETALDYLKQSLSIQQKIGDKAGEGTTLNNISGIYNARGDYKTALDYLKQSLAIKQEIGNKSGESTTLNNISQIYDAFGDHETALDYLKQSLAIQQEISDSAGLCGTLLNMGYIHWQNDQQQEAISAWLSVYQLAKPMQQADVLQALESLAGQLGLEGGLDGWEQLAKQLEEQT